MQARAERILRMAANAKARHYVFAARLEKGKSTLGAIMRKKYDLVTTFLYEPVENVEEIRKRFLLAHLIAEKYVLYHERNLLKNIVLSIVGVSGSGKTTYAVLSALGALDLLYEAGYTEAKNIDVKNLLFLTQKDLIEGFAKLRRENKWVPFIIVDDVASMITKYWFMLKGRERWANFFRIIDQVKDITGVLILTAKAFKGVASRLREISDFIVYANEYLDVEGTVADVFYFKPVDEESAPLIDVMPPTVRMPEEIWQYMMHVRRSESTRILDELVEKFREEEREGIGDKSLLKGAQP